MSKFRIGIIGSGFRGIYSFGKMLVARPDAELVALADTNGERPKAAAKTLGITPAIYPSAEAMLAAEQLDGVIITTPDYLHEAHAIAAFKSGAHILVDKPMATTVAGCLRIIRAAKEAGRELTVGFNMRHLPILQTVKKMIDDGVIGRLMLIENREFYNGGRTYMARWNRRREWSGGLWIHKGTHDFDIFNWFNPEGRPKAVTASAGVNALRADRIPFTVEPGKPVGPHCSACAYKTICPDAAPVDEPLFNDTTASADNYRRDLCLYTSDKDVHDNGIALVEYDNNVRASHLECFVCNFTDREYTLVGDRGTIVCALSKPDTFELRPRWGKENQTITVPKPEEGGHGGSDPRLLADFINTIRTGASRSANVRDGVRAVAVGEAAERSWREGRLVRISELVDWNDPLLA